MQILSAIFYFISQHPFWSFPLILLLGVVISTVMAIRKRRELTLDALKASQK